MPWLWRGWLWPRRRHRRWMSRLWRRRHRRWMSWLWLQRLRLRRLRRLCRRGRGLGLVGLGLGGRLRRWLGRLWLGRLLRIVGRLPFLLIGAAFSPDESSRPVCAANRIWLVIAGLDPAIHLLSRL